MNYVKGKIRKRKPISIPSAIRIFVKSFVKMKVGFLCGLTDIHFASLQKERKNPPDTLHIGEKIHSTESKQKLQSFSSSSLSRLCSTFSLKLIFYRRQTRSLSSVVFKIKDKNFTTRFMRRNKK